MGWLPDDRSRSLVISISILALIFSQSIWSCGRRKEEMHIYSIRPFYLIQIECMTLKTLEKDSGKEKLRRNNAPSQMT